VPRDIRENLIRGRNINDIYPVARGLLDQVGVRQSSRAGDVLVAPGPVFTSYARPAERVLFDPVRDANPFFHLMESLWMLAGSADARWLDRYVSDFSARYAETDGHVWGGYGRRWRDWFRKNSSTLGGPRLDQLVEVVRLLRKDPTDRRVVIQMWDASEDLGADRRDVPCNTQCYPRVRESLEVRGGDLCVEKVLDLTVICRSNDVVWGAYGANAVHFSVLQEYLAHCVGVEVGVMYQVSNNWHGYVDVLAKKPAPVTSEDPYFRGEVVPLKMFQTQQDFVDADLRAFVARPCDEDHRYHNEWFRKVAAPVAISHRFHREKNREAALFWADVIAAPDWRRACLEWLQRRYVKK
jgi:thymidylate synthase